MVEMMVTSSVLILAILLFRRFANGKVSMRFRYALWLVAALRLMLPVSLGNSAVSVMNLWPQSLQGVAGEVQEVKSGWVLPGIRQADAVGVEGNIVPDVMPAGETFGGEVSVKSKTGEEIEGLAGKDISGREKEEREGASAKIPADLPSEAGRMTFEMSGKRIPAILRTVWLFGILSVSAYMIISRVRFGRILYRLRRIVGAEKIPDELADRLTARRMKVYQVKGLASPCLVGRNIYVDTRLLKDRQKLGHVLAHEYCHAAQFDSFWAFLRSALVAVYWFHPLVWVAAFAARQDSELACDEAAIRLLGEEERFAYGRTLLYLLSGENGRIDCAGTALTMEGRKRDVKERVRMIAQSNQRKGWAAAVVVMMLLACGCAFTGREQEQNVRYDDGKDSVPEGLAAETIQKQAGELQAIADASDTASERIRNEYENVTDALDMQEQALRQAQKDAAFASVLDYQGVMAGKDDSELALDRELDYQAYYDYLGGKQNSQGKEQEEPPENGWYLLCRNEEARISLYGLYTQEFGPRGIKTLIGEDVNTYDIAWCPSGMNRDSANIRTLESAEDGLPRKFVFKILAENTSDREIWKLYSGFRYDTGTVEMEELTAQMYRDWADRHLSFAVSASGDEVLVTYDGDMVLAPLDISAYQDQKVEGVAISPDVAGFQLDDGSLVGESYGEQDGFEGVVLPLAVGLKLEGMDGVWFDGLHPLIVQVLCYPGQEPAFVLQQPRIAEQAILHSLTQQRQLEEIRAGKGVNMGPDEAAGYLSKPLVNSEEAHHDLEIAFLNPCPDYVRISDGYGERKNPVTGEIKKHNGVDMAADMGTAVVAAADGRVYETGFDAEDGNYVVLWHGQSGQMTYYTHCEEVLVSKNDQVLAGDKIATVGSTGRSTGSHLHFAVSYDGEWQEPFWN